MKHQHQIKIIIIQFTFVCEGLKGQVLRHLRRFVA